MKDEGAITSRVHLVTWTAFTHFFYIIDKPHFNHNFDLMDLIVDAMCILRYFSINCVDRDRPV